MVRKLTYLVRQEDVPCTVGKLIKRKFDLTDHQISRLKFRDQGIMLDGRQVRTSAEAVEGSRLEICVEDADKTVRDRVPGGFSAEKDHPRLSVLYEDQDLLIVNKPAGMAVHRGRGHYADTLTDLAEKYLVRESGRSAGAENPALHTAGRLDKDTSGAAVFARNAVCAAKLQQQRLLSGTFRKTYLAVAAGPAGRPGEEFIINTPLMRDPRELNKMMTAEADPAVPETGAGPGKTSRILPAVTHVHVLQANEEYSTIEIWLETGRTHQIRVHMMSIAHPLLGDPVYGSPANPYGIHRAALHCRKVELLQPFTGEKISVTAPLPEDMESFFPVPAEQGGP